MTSPGKDDIIKKIESEGSNLKAEELLKSINFSFSHWITYVKLNNCSNLYDVNKISEGFVCSFLNAIYGWALSDLNAQQKNQCAIDLGDTQNGFAIQVTSRTDTKKIKDTLQKFSENQLEKIYPNGVKFFIISDHSVKKGRTKWETSFPYFDFDRDIIYPSDIIDYVSKMVSKDIDKLEQVQNICSKYIGTKSNTIPNDEQIIEDIVRCFDRPAFVTPFMMESDLPNFEKAIDDTIQAVNTGVYCLRNGTEIRRIKSRFSISDQKSKEIMGQIVDKLMELRMQYREFLKTGDVRRCGCGQENCGVHMITPKAGIEMDKTRKEIIAQLNSLSSGTKIHFLER